VSCEQYKTKDDLIDGKCPEHNIEPVLMKEESYFFKLSHFQEILQKKISSDEIEIQPEERKNEVLSFIKRGLKDISISRKNVKWGISLPFDKSYTTYVWIDAFLNYLTGLGWDGKDDSFPEMWPPEVQLMSKDILRVHSTIWLGILSAFGFPLTKKIFVHGYFTINGQKMSKSLGNVIWPQDLIDKFGVDGTRYLLMSSLAYGQDGDITFEKLIEKYNADLPNGIGNLLRRVLTMVDEKLNGVIPAESKPPTILKIMLNGYKESLDNFKFKEAIEKVFEVIKYVNENIDRLEIYKKSAEDASKDLYVFLEMLRIKSWLLLPFLPETSDEIFKQLGLDPKKEKEKDFEKAIKWGGLQPGIKIRKGEILFKRI
jgi:methionyl-tRNA synthetase